MNIAELTHANAFPYDLLLLFYRERVESVELRGQIAKLVEEDSRWQAHWQSIRYLDLERIVAVDDAKLLHQFDLTEASGCCRAVAETDGAVFDAILAGQPSAHGRTAAEWKRETERCVYCRRMLIRQMARSTAAHAGLSADEPLLRDWLLSHYYQQRLDEISRQFRPQRRGVILLDRVTSQAESPAPVGSLAASSGAKPVEDSIAVPQWLKDSDRLKRRLLSWRTLAENSPDHIWALLVERLAEQAHGIAASADPIDALGDSIAHLLRDEWGQAAEPSDPRARHTAMAALALHAGATWEAEASGIGELLRSDLVALRRKLHGELYQSATSAPERDAQIIVQDFVADLPADRNSKEIERFLTVVRSLWE